MLRKQIVDQVEIIYNWDKPPTTRGIFSIKNAKNLCSKFLADLGFLANLEGQQEKKLDIFAARNGENMGLSKSLFRIVQTVHYDTVE